jgi:NMD protein affecting ribosome stability and mRNA decay
MNRSTWIVLSLCGICGFAQAASVEHGQALHDAHCKSCHDTSVYTRANRLVTSRAALEAQVGRCEVAQDLAWTDQDIADVIAYLDANFYHFGEEGTP